MALDLLRIKALCFDVDGTLRDTDDQWVGRLSGALRPAGFLIPRGDVQGLARRIVMSIDDPANLAMHLADRLGLDNLAHNLLRRAAAARQPAHAPPAMIAGVGEMLARLAERYPMSIVSARSERGTMEFLAGHGLLHHFKVIVTGQTCRFTKPFPDPVLFAARAMGIPPDRCLMVGDTIVDIMAGRSAGAQTVGVLCGFGEEPELRRRGANLILSTTALLEQVLIPESDRAV